MNAPTGTRTCYASLVSWHIYLPSAVGSHSVSNAHHPQKMLNRSFVIPGLHQHPTTAHLRVSNTACVVYRFGREKNTDHENSYNHLPSDDEQPTFSQDVGNLLAELRAIFCRHAADTVFGLHLIHGHFKIPEDEVMIGSRLEDSDVGWWTRAMKIDLVSRQHIHGHVFIVSDDSQLLPYEYRQGSPSDRVATISDMFFVEFCAFLMSNRLDKIFGLQILDDVGPAQEMLEFVFSSKETVMIPRFQTDTYQVYRDTGWSFSQNGDGTVVLKGNEAHAGPLNGPHRIFTDGKRFNEPGAILESLRTLGIAST